MLIKLKNYGLVRNQTIEFKPGLNVIRGESGSGKSTVIRGIEGAIFNATGDSYITQGESKAEIEITYNEHTVRRIRDIQKATKTLYYVDDEKFSKVGSAPVEKVLEAFSIKEIKIANGSIRPNFLSQFSVPFLINESPAKIFDYLTLTSKATNLKDVDVSISEDIKTLNADKKSKVETIDTLKRMISSSEEILKKEDEFNNIYTNFKELEIKYNLCNNLISNVEKIKSYKQNVNQIENKIENKNNILSTLEIRDNILDDIQKLKNINLLVNKIKEQKQKIEKLNNKIEKYNKVIQDETILEKVKERIEGYRGIVSNYEFIIHVSEKLSTVSNRIEIISNSLKNVNGFEEKDIPNRLTNIKNICNIKDKTYILSRNVKSLEEEGLKKKKEFDDMNKKIDKFRRDNMRIIVCTTVDSLCSEFEITKEEFINMVNDNTK